MINFTQGWVENSETGVRKDIIVKAATPNTLKDALIGGGLVLIGITYLTVKAYKKGSAEFELAEWQAMIDAGIVVNNNSAKS